ncbi:phage holin family protein [Pseudophaeobacter sp.]|uniref:phage holin family protein n=1 Tax=Pseudophaeobacter sp. TaxID=1971739 RepID=UPI0026366001|nr:phage holin family protein [Pseudophaeobacter sp.]
MLDQVKHSAASAARKAGLLTGGLLCVLVGAGFLTAAAWIYLATAFDALMAAGIIGSVYTGLGLVTIGLSRSGESVAPPPKQPATSQSAPDAPPLMQAFLFGLQAGASSEQRRS